MQKNDVINLDYISWDEKLWKKYLKSLKRTYRWVTSDRMGELRLSEDQQNSEFQIQVIVKSALSEFMDRYQPVEITPPEQQMTCILPLDEEPESCTYLFYSTRLAILQTDEKAKEWLLQYFMDLRLFYHKNYINFLFLEEELEQILDLAYIPYQTIEESGGILSFIRTYINAGEYCNVHLDEFYLPVKEHFQSRHFVHENLIYGFDDEREEIYAYGMAERQQTRKYTISYEDFVIAYEKGKLFSFCGASYLEQEGYAPVLLCQIGEVPEYHFSWEMMQRKMHAFIQPNPEEMVGEDLHVYGSEIYRWIMRELTGETDYGMDDFRIFQLLYEQKQCVSQRMKRLQERNLIPAEYLDIPDKYQKVVGDFQSMRIIYLKQLLQEGAMDHPVKRITHSGVRCKLAKTLQEAAQREDRILREVAGII